MFNNHSYKWASANGLRGYVIAPDGFEGTLSSTYADDAALAANNLVFLLAAGHRRGSDVSLVGANGYYWSSTAFDSVSTYYLYIDSDGAYPNDGYDDRSTGYFGYSVRLVTEVK